MDDEDKEERDRIFGKFDANGDGKISSSELGEALKTLGSVTPEEVQTMMDELDTDGDGFISYEEFTNFYNDNRGLMKDLGKIF
ncbi:putative EF-hand domain pair protein CML [Helianthus annuus]|uniref:Calcium binding protein n=1 Tax=Helianthus annuus TaxID=4232 RepID=A0A251T483_HELAN|nr:polcalcin Syr v 3 [Helianthus annuus]KAF5778763.1 putative calcium binding protein [Helianthus annuus]KAJ0490122.1 putative EF-hand domain-containing protein [Helianthus annuus]KAJ0494227.1 putative EF-hand domain pair protein CML [Helianthus annuus]KAJ0506037.1 putative EF-hand domain-containing protein [Helianthus annuus]KAJ0675707.1 putative EF-hand domain-containing protein [Helianthus annuus]